MTTLFFFVPPADIDAADRQDHYWQPYYQPARKVKKKKHFKIVKVGRKIEAMPLDVAPLNDLAMVLDRIRKVQLRQREEERIILHFITEGEL